VSRELELEYKRGFDAGVKHQREAAPPPKAREMKKQLEAKLVETELLAALLEPSPLEEALATVELDPRPPVTLRDATPLAILRDCERVAVRAGWTHARWKEFSVSFMSCFTPAASPEELAASLRIVAERFAADVRFAGNDSKAAAGA